MGLSVEKWWIRQVSATGHGCVMNFDNRYNGKNWDNKVKLSKIQNKPSWEVFVDFVSQMDPNSAAYPYFATIKDNDNFFQVPLKNKYSMRAGIQYGVPESYGPIPNGIGNHNVQLSILNSDGRLLIAQSGFYTIQSG